MPTVVTRFHTRSETQVETTHNAGFLFNAQGITKVNMKHLVSVSRAILGTSPGSGLGERVGGRSRVHRVVVLSVGSSVLSAYSLPGLELWTGRVHTGPGQSGSRPEPVGGLGIPPRAGSSWTGSPAVALVLSLRSLLTLPLSPLL